MSLCFRGGNLVNGNSGISTCDPGIISLKREKEENFAAAFSWRCYGFFFSRNFVGLTSRVRSGNNLSISRVSFALAKSSLYMGWHTHGPIKKK